jgi:hypothetical protein
VGLTAEDLWPLVSRLSPEERIRLIRLTIARGAVASSDAVAYERVPVGSDEFHQDSYEDPLAWDAEGWDDLP